jgi:hypothetical protein
MILWLSISESDFKYVLASSENQRWIKTIRNIVVHEQFDVKVQILEDGVRYATRQVELSEPEKNAGRILTKMMLPWSLTRGKANDLEETLGLDVLFNESYVMTAE